MPKSAKVLWWNEDKIHLRCPVCSEIHERPTPSKSARISTQYPHGLPESEYEIDKENLRFVALGANPPLPELETSVTQMMGGLNLDETSPQLPGPSEEVRQGIVRGNRVFLENHLRSLRESGQLEAFLRGFDRDGNTALGLAVTSGNYKIVKLLLDSGAPANGFDQRRRNPLMWAALWGHYRIAQLLMDHGAYNGFEDIDGFTAIDLAQPSERNEDERHRHPDYKGWTKNASTERKMIVNCVTLPTLPPKRIGPESIKRWFFQESCPLQFSLFGISISEIHLPRAGKAVGILSRGGKYPPLATKSGWAADVLNSEMEEISPTGSCWRDKAMQIGQKIGYPFSRHHCDETEPGQYLASHVEPKLIAYFISKHVFLPWELRENESLRRLEQATPRSGMLTQAIIRVNKAPCDDCEHFKDAVNAVLGLEIKLINALISNSTEAVSDSLRGL
ncbi:hypothetical protein IWX46DRAFT_629782 [Phyllosticta citricarpa]|uniref:Single-strand DNA deaminase toxin A-like C-terminal domain-containing protein n=1 Tax=Phyllosticta citricarpa TaxID=55181 RepID=A0ABR1LK92_9PEZI